MAINAAPPGGVRGSPRRPSRCAWPRAGRGMWRAGQWRQMPRGRSARCATRMSWPSALQLGLPCGHQRFELVEQVAIAIANRVDETGDEGRERPARLDRYANGIGGPHRVEL